MHFIKAADYVINWEYFQYAQVVGDTAVVTFGEGTGTRSLNVPLQEWKAILRDFATAKNLTSPR